MERGQAAKTNPSPPRRTVHQSEALSSGALDTVATLKLASLPPEAQPTDLAVGFFFFRSRMPGTT